MGTRQLVRGRKGRGLGRRKRVQEGYRILHAGMRGHWLEGGADFVLVLTDVFEEDDVSRNLDIQETRLPPVFTHLLAAYLKCAAFFNAAQDAATKDNLAHDVGVNP